MDDPFEAQRWRRHLFSSNVAAYESGRPGYPERVSELLRQVCGLGPTSRVLEIGPGTGQATGRLLDLSSAGTPRAGAHALDAAARIAEIDASGLGAVRHETIAWLALPDGQRRELLEEIERLAAETFGGLVERPYLTPAYLARRRD